MAQVRRSYLSTYPLVSVLLRPELLLRLTRENNEGINLRLLRSWRTRLSGNKAVLSVLIFIATQLIDLWSQHLYRRISTFSPDDGAPLTVARAACINS